MAPRLDPRFFAPAYRPWSSYGAANTADPEEPAAPTFDMRPDSSGIFSPTNVSASSGGPNPVRDIYAPRLTQVGQQLQSAYDAPHAGLARQLIGAFVGNRNPALGGIISGETQRTRRIQPLEQEYGLLSNIIAANRAQQTQDITNRLHSAQADYFEQRPDLMTQPKPTLDEQTFEYLQKQINLETQKPYTPFEARVKLAQELQDVKPDKSTTETPHTVQVGNRIKQWNPQTKKFDIDVGPSKPESEGNWTFAEDNNGNPVLFNPKTGETKAAPPGIHPKGSMGLTNTTKSMVEIAPKVKDLIGRMQGQIADAQNGLGPMSSRWREFTAGKVGLDDPAFSALRTNAALLQTALMRMHVGARGGVEIMQHFKDLFDVAKQSPENLNAALGEVGAYADDVIAEGKKHGMNFGGPTPASGTTKMKTPDGKVWNVPADKVEAAKQRGAVPAE